VAEAEEGTGDGGIPEKRVYKTNVVINTDLYVDMKIEERMKSITSDTCRCRANVGKTWGFLGAVLERSWECLGRVL